MLEEFCSVACQPSSFAMNSSATGESEEHATKRLLEHLEFLESDASGTPPVFHLLLSNHSPSLDTRVEGREAHCETVLALCCRAEVDVSHGCLLHWKMEHTLQRHHLHLLPPKSQHSFHVKLKIAMSRLNKESARLAETQNKSGWHVSAARQLLGLWSTVSF